MIEFYRLKGVRRGDEWLWHANEDAFAASPFVLEQFKGADGMTRYDVRNGAGEALQRGTCIDSGTSLTLDQERCKPLVWACESFGERQQ